MPTFCCLERAAPAWRPPSDLAPGFALALVYPVALKGLGTWFRQGRGFALGAAVGALTLGSALPYLINGLGGVDWEFVVAATSALTLAGGLIALFLWKDGPFASQRAKFDPRLAGRIFSDREVRLATFGYFGHQWELYGMWAWYAVFFRD